MSSIRLALLSAIALAGVGHALMLQHAFEADAALHLAGHGATSNRSVTILTTASIPWFTGTAVNPAMRAAYLAKAGYNVTLVVPWVANPSDQQHLFSGTVFSEPQEQEAAIRQWLEDQSLDLSQLPLQILWYEATWFSTAGCLVAQNPLEMLPANHSRDILVAEEPEHLGTFDSGPCWKSQFNHVIGIIHTNYDHYMENVGIPVVARLGQTYFWETLICNNVDLVVRLSGFKAITTQLSTVVPTVVANINGVAEKFLQIGEQVTAPDVPPEVPAYFIGSALWDKGYANLLAMAEKVSELRVDTYGSGNDEQAIRTAAAQQTAGRVKHHSRVSHSDFKLRNYSILVNPSTSDVLCTVTMEALAMGKGVVLVRDPSNTFFIDGFPGRVFAYESGDPTSFSAAYDAALAAGLPRPLSAAQAERLTWDAGTQRFLEVALTEESGRHLSRTSDDLEQCANHVGMPEDQVHAHQKALWSAQVLDILPFS